MRANVPRTRTRSTDRSWLAVTDDLPRDGLRDEREPAARTSSPRALKDIYTDRVSSYVFPEENRDHVRETHGAIAEAIITRDAATAERLMHDHMAKLADFFEARYPGLMDEPVNWH